MLPASPQRTAVDRVELDHALAHRLDDPPAAGHGPQADGRGGQQDHRQRHDRPTRDDPCREEREGDDTHRLLCVVRAVAEGHEPGRDDLQPTESFVQAGWSGSPEEPVDRDHQRERDGESGNR